MAYWAEIRDARESNHQDQIKDFNIDRADRHHPFTSLFQFDTSEFQYIIPR